MSVPLSKMGLWALCMALCGSPAALAQQNAAFSVQGRAIDCESREPVSYATVSVRNESAGIAGAVVTGTDGKFSVPVKEAGDYELQISFTGYTPATQEISLTEENPKLDVGTIELTAGITTNEVTVVAQQPLVTTEIDKIVYNTEADPETPSLNGLEMMRKVPLLTVDGEDNLKLKGQSNFKILVNGKTSTLMSSNYKDVLKSWPAGSIKKIEVITDPPSKYDADGIDGIINIITVKKTNNGYNGSLSINGGLRHTDPNFGGSAYIAAAIGKFNVSGNYGVNHGKNKGGSNSGYSENFLSDEYRTTRSSSGYESNWTGHNMGVEASYEIDTFNLITLSFNGYIGNNEYGGTAFSDTYDVGNTLSRSFRTLNSSTSNYGWISGNVDYQKTFMKPDRTFTVSYRMERNIRNSSFENLIDETFNYDGYRQYSKNKSHGTEHTIQADYYDPLTKEHQIEAGIKYILRPQRSNTDNFRMENEVWVPYNQNQQNMNYDEHVASMYAGYVYKLKKFSAKGGVRGEYSINEGDVEGNQTTYHLDNRNFNVVPYVNFSYKPKENHTIGLSYTQRLQRPGIWYLNPYRDDEDPLNIRQGNPDLKSVISNNFNLSYNAHGKIYNVHVSASASFSNKTIEQETTIDREGVRTSTYENLGTREQYGGFFYGNLRLLDNKLTFSLSVGSNYVKINANNGSGLKNQGWNHYGHFTLNARPWKNGNVSVYTGGGTPSLGLQYKSNSYYYHGMSVSHGFFDRKLNLSLSVSEPLTKKRTYSGESFGEGFMSRYDGFYWARSFRASLSWRFGKMQTQVKKARRGISNDDKMSGGESSSGQGGGGQ